MDLSEAEYRHFLARGLPYQRAVTLPPGRYQVRLAVREDALGLLGSAWQRIEVPELAPGHLTLSSLFLLKESERAPGAGEPGARPRPAERPGAAPLQPQRKPVRAVYAYNPKRDDTGRRTWFFRPRSCAEA